MSAAGAGPILALSLALLLAQRGNAALAIAATQAAVLAASAAVQGLYPEAALLLLLNTIGLPWLVFRPISATPPRPRFGVLGSLSAAGVLTLLAAPMSVSLAVVLLGILTAAASRDRTIQVVGLLAMQNGIALAGLGLAEPERIAAIVPAIPALAWAALWVSRGRAA